MRFMRGIYYDKDGGGEGGGSGSGQGGSGLEQRLEQAFANLANRQGGTDAAGVLLLQENRAYRDQIRELQQQLQDLQGQVPADDAVVLSGDDATAWQAYQELGAPDELRQQREQYQTLQRRQLLTEAAKTAGYKVSVLEKLAGDVTVELREQRQDGKAMQLPYVVDGDNATLLTEYAEQHWTDFLPSLREQQGGTGRSFVNQVPMGTAPNKNMADRFLEEKQAKEAERKNPLQQ